MGVVAHLQQVRAAASLTRALALSHEFAAASVHEVETGRDARDALASVTAALADTDHVLAIAALHACTRIDDTAVDALLEEAMRDRRAHIREHAAWACAARPFHEPSVAGLIELCTESGLGGMLAQQCLEAWGRTHPECISIRLISALHRVRPLVSRRLLVETLGLVRSSRAAEELRRIQADPREPALVRDAAHASLADFTSEPCRVTTQNAQGGVTVAQLFLGADIDAGLRRVGSGNNGGIATLLVRLGDALVASAGAAHTADDHSVRRVLTLSRAGAEAAGDARAPAPDSDASASHSYDTVSLAAPGANGDDAWSNYVSARRGITQALRQHGPVDILHLRMADVGTFAAWHAARDLGISVVFTAAPDPHALIETLDERGALTRENFGDRDISDRYWFRTRLVYRLARTADHTVLMPRERLRDDFGRLVGIDIGAGTSASGDDSSRVRTSFTPVAEGIDVAVIDHAVTEATTAANGGAPTPALSQLQLLLSSLPEARRSLPLLISVGRLHRVKGMADIVAAWAESELRDQCNLLIVGGDLRAPSADETEQLARIDALVDPAHRCGAGLLLAGHRPNAVAAQWMAAAQTGVPGFAAPHGVYVCGSVKEEFGLAILEALAAGLFVVAPERGGPATYVEHGRTGLLTDTANGTALRTAIVDALAIARGPRATERARRARRTVLERFSIRTMAKRLTRVYGSVLLHSSDREASPLTQVSPHPNCTLELESRP